MLTSVFESPAAVAALIAGLFGVTQWVMNRVASKKDKQDNNSEKRLTNLESSVESLSACIQNIGYATQQDLRDKITSRCKTSIKQGYIDLDDYENLVNLHNAYHKVGGNGYLDDLMEKVKHLPNT